MDRPRSSLRPLSLFALSFVAFLVALSGWAAKSQALNYCVPNMTGVCDQSFATIQGALNQAESNPGHDNVWIASGSYAGNFTYNDTSAGNTIGIRGTSSGPGQTKLTLGSTVGGAIGLYVNAPNGSLIKDLQLTLPPDSDGNGDQGMAVYGQTGGNITVEGVRIDGPHSSGASAAWCGNCLIKASDIDMTSDGAYPNFGVRQNGGPAHLYGVSVKAHDGFTHGSPNERSTIDHSRIEAHIGVATDGGFIDVGNSLILLDDESGAVGINFRNMNTGTYEMGGDIEGTTIVNGVQNSGGSPGNSTGVLAVADSPAESVTATMTDSVILGFTNFPFGRTLELGVNFNGALDFSTSYSAYDNGMLAESYDGDGSNLHYTIGDGHLDLQDGPGYVNPVGADFTPSAGSPLVDAGDPSDPAVGATDLAGNPRACHGKADGVIRRDIGAVERKVNPADDCTYPETSISDGPEAYPPAMYTSDSVKFVLASTKAGSTFRCSIDDAAKPCDASFTTPDLSRGPHTFSGSAVDSFGNIDQTPVERTFYVGEPKGPPPTCETDPSFCPRPDKTAPKVLGLKAPKKTRAARVKVRFKSNESGVTFTCKLNRGKAKRCNSPWKTPRLRKGKNTIAVQATDKAGNRSKIVKRTIKRIVRRK